MTVRQRAVLARDKEARHEAILDAAERLLLRDATREASVADVAGEAGLAKGTVYLYFTGKEALLLALHERHVVALFDALEARLGSASAATVDEVLAIVRTHMVDPPLFLPLASRCLGALQQDGALPVAASYRARMGESASRVGAGLERHFAGLAKGGGVLLLRESFALVLGLWQIDAVRQSAGDGVAAKGASSAAGSLGAAGGGGTASATPARHAFSAEVDRALAALWRGTLAPTR